MQAVNPKISLPYWEFTKELPMGITIYESIMFSEDTFGSLNKPADSSRGFTYELDTIEMGTIPNGRWANLKADMNTRMPTIPTNYGYIRSPWNANPSPYITRFANDDLPLPSCADYELAVTTYDSAVDFMSDMQRGPHASIHAVLGNVFGCDVLDELVDLGYVEDEEARSNLCRQWSYFMKDLYRDDYFNPKTCTLDSSAALNDFSCGYECVPENLNAMVSALQLMMGKEYMASDMSHTDWIKVRDFICTGNGYKVIVGSHMDSTSASDPSFWPAHPTQERLVHAYLMATQYDGTFQWETTDKYVCDASKCYSDETGTKDYHDICCYGHNQEDRWLDFVTPDRDQYIGLTNIEVMLATNPYSEDYSMPYIYDTFSYGHCTNHDVDGALLARYDGETIDLEDDVKANNLGARK
jgi:hypothetical protein